MGMYDSIYMEVTCPYCGERERRECQTKDLDCVLDNWEVGETIGTSKHTSLDCIVGCYSEKCQHYNKNIRFRRGSRTFELKVFLNNGVITGEYEIIKS